MPGAALPRFRAAKFSVVTTSGSGKIDSAEWIEADADETAIDDAHVRFPDGGFELWNGQRLIDSRPRRRA